MTQDDILEILNKDGFNIDKRTLSRWRAEGKLYPLTRVGNEYFADFEYIEKIKQLASLNGGINNGDLRGVFLRDNYKFLPVENKIVLDIGANIGDSSIYFALKGSKKIISLEPFPKNYEMVKKTLN
ncbi:MAG: FkbM family methyltransferase [Thaumarchaeota archaeon]|nr:FkbM family methyltransferase [Nitrososphaerota archaeon]